MTVKVTFEYEPTDPDPDDHTGLSADEYDDLTQRLMELGAENIQVRKETE